VPYSDPSAPLQQQGWWWLLAVPIFEAVCNSVFPVLLAATAGMDRRMRAIIYPAGAAVFVTLVMYSLSRSLEVFPLPLGSLICDVVATLAMPLLWLCVPPWQRRDAAFRRLFHPWMQHVDDLSWHHTSFMDGFLQNVENEALQALLIFARLHGHQIGLRACWGLLSFTLGCRCHAWFHLLSIICLCYELVPHFSEGLQLAKGFSSAR